LFVALPTSTAPPHSFAAWNGTRTPTPPSLKYVVHRYAMLANTAHVLRVTGTRQRRAGVVHLMATQVWNPRLRRFRTISMSRIFPGLAMSERGAGNTIRRKPGRGTGGAGCVGTRRLPFSDEVTERSKLHPEPMSCEHLFCLVSLLHGKQTRSDR